MRQEQHRRGTTSVATLAVVVPLAGFEPATHRVRTDCASRCATEARVVVPPAGVAPASHRVKADCIIYYATGAKLFATRLFISHDRSFQYQEPGDDAKPSITQHRRLLLTYLQICNPSAGRAASPSYVPCSVTRPSLPLAPRDSTWGLQGVTLAGFEPATSWFATKYSVLLNYRVVRGAHKSVARLRPGSANNLRALSFAFQAISVRILPWCHRRDLNPQSRAGNDF